MLNSDKSVPYAAYDLTPRTPVPTPTLLKPLDHGHIKLSQACQPKGHAAYAATRELKSCSPKSALVTSSSQAGSSGGPTLSGGHEPAIVPQLADSAYGQPHLLEGMGQARSLRSTSDAASFAAGGHSALGQHASLLGSARLWTITAAHTHGFSSPRRQPCLLPRRRAHPHLHGDTDSGPPACTSTARGWPAASSPCRLTSSPCHGLGPHQALASSPYGTSGTCCRRDSGSGTASASTRASSQVSWHHRPQILGLRQRACPRVCRQDTSQPLAHAATHHRGPARRCQLHAASHLASRVW